MPMNRSVSLAGAGYGASTAVVAIVANRPHRYKFNATGVTGLGNYPWEATGVTGLSGDLPIAQSAPSVPATQQTPTSGGGFSAALVNLFNPLAQGYLTQQQAKLATAQNKGTAVVAAPAAPSLLTTLSSPIVLLGLAAAGLVAWKLWR